MKHKQRGVTFLSLVILGIVVALAGVLAAQVVPTVVEYQSILKAAQRASEKGSTVADIRRSFDASAAADYFSAIDSRDLEISKDNDKIVVEFAYDKEIHLVGPAFLVLKYTGRTH